MPLSNAVVSIVLGSVLALDAQQAPSLKIVVLEGEGAVNIIQQKTAVRPLVEVRDRNNLPVAGASVTFTIGGGGQGAFAGGLQTLTVTTNAAGQAAASGLNAVTSGAFQIQVQAAYQGQVATAAISQTNFATAAAATQAGAGAGGGGGTASGATGGAAGGGGGGLSGTTIGIIGAAVGGGALAATQVVGKSSDESDAVTFDVYTGSLSGQLAITTVSSQGQQSSCTRTNAVTGSMTIQVSQGGAPGAPRTARMQVSLSELSVTGTCLPNSTPTTFSLTDVPVTGELSALTFTASTQIGITDPITTYTVGFKGSLSGTTITGTVGIDAAQRGTNSGGGATTFPVTLQK